MLDGTVRMVRSNVSPTILRNYVTPSGGEAPQPLPSPPDAPEKRVAVSPPAVKEIREPEERPEQQKPKGHTQGAWGTPGVVTKVDGDKVTFVGITLNLKAKKVEKADPKTLTVASDAKIQQMTRFGPGPPVATLLKDGLKNKVFTEISEKGRVFGNVKGVMANIRGNGEQVTEITI